MKRTKKHYHLILKAILPGLIILLVNAGTGFSQYVPFTQITDDEAPQEYPAFWGYFIAYEDQRNGGDPDIYLYNTLDQTEIALTQDPNTSAKYPDIYESRVVWQDNRSGDWDIFTYNTNTPAIDPQPLFTWEGDQIEPAIYGDYLAFTDKKPGVTSYNIWTYQFSTGNLQRLTDDTDGDQRVPDIFENVVVWQDARMGNRDIYMYSITTDEYRIITDDPADQVHPSIDNYRIVWEDYRDGDANIYMENLRFGIGTVFEGYDWPIVAGDNPSQQDPSSQKYPHIYDDNLVFMDFRNGNWDVYLYKFFNPIVGNLHRITTEAQDQKYPVAYDKYVVWQDERRWDGSGPYASDIWMWEFPPGADLGIYVETNGDPIELGAELHYYVHVYNAGPQDAQNVELFNRLPSNVDFVTVYNNSGLGCSRVGRELTCLLGTIPSGEGDTVEIVVSAVEEDELVNFTMVSSDEDDLNPDNNEVYTYTTVQWKVPAILGPGYMPNFDMDASGNIHVTYLSEIGDPDNLNYAMHSRASWSHHVLDDKAIECMLDVDSDDSVHIAYVEMDYDNSGQYTLNYIKGFGDQWNASQKLEDNFSGIYNIDISVSPSGIVYISYLDNRWGGDVNIFYYKNGSWHGPFTVQNVSGYNDQALEVDGNGKLHIVFYSLGMNQGLFYLTNAPDSAWQSPEHIEANWDGSQLETLSLDLALGVYNKPHVSYVGQHNQDNNENFKYANKTGVNWDFEKVRSQNMGNPNTLDVDQAGHAHLLLHDMDLGELVYSHNISGSWQNKIIDFWPDEISDIMVDGIGYVHMIYSKDGLLKYVTDTPPPLYPEISVTPTELDFWKYVVGDTTDGKTVTIRNIGESNLVIDDIKLVWPDSLHFSFEVNGCDVLTPGESCTVEVAFNPQSWNDKVALLWIESNDPDNDVTSVKLTGEGLEALVYATGNPDFGDVEVGDSASTTFSLFNIGNTYASVQLITIEGDDPGSFYALDAPATPFQLESGDTIEFDIVFKPTDIGEKQAVLKIFTTGNDNIIEMEGNAIAPTFSISGAVSLPGGAPVTAGIVRLFVQEGTFLNSYRYIDLTASATYLFSGLSVGNYTVLVEPSAAIYADYVPTFLGNVWRPGNAEILEMHASEGNRDIELVTAPEDGSGSASISGIFMTTGNAGGRAWVQNSAFEEGNPVANVPLVLLNEQNDLVAFAHSETNGTFTFDKLNVGNYDMIAYYEGWMMDPGRDVITIAGEEEEIEISVLADAGQINVKVEKVTVLEELHESRGLRVYPNPAHSQLNIQFDQTDMQVPIFFQVMDLNGRMVYENTQNRLKSSGDMSININQLPDGVYILKVVTPNKAYKSSFIKKER
jgi:uncharacterized repeat protein (TIGR01451 family)